MMCGERNWQGWNIESNAICEQEREFHRDRSQTELGIQPVKDETRYSELVERMPITFRPFVNEKLAGMSRLFEFERKSIESFLDFIEKLSPGDFELLFKPGRTVEKKWARSDEHSPVRAKLWRTPSCWLIRRSNRIGGADTHAHPLERHEHRVVINRLVSTCFFLLFARKSG